jgi:hypothetical protein
MPASNSFRLIDDDVNTESVHAAHGRMKRRRRNQLRQLYQANPADAIREFGGGWREYVREEDARMEAVRALHRRLRL